MHIRRLVAADFADAERILNAAFARPGNRRPDLERAVALTPDCWFLAVTDAKPVGMVGAVIYGQHRAWVGLMAVDPAVQSRGVGRALMRRVLEELDGRGVGTVLLDASPAGHTLYLSLGFVDEDAAWMCEPAGAGDVSAPPMSAEVGRVQVAAMTDADLAAVAVVDAAAFGADRTRLLALLFAEFPGRGLVARDASGHIVGYALVQARRIGPWVAVSTEAAEALLRAALQLPFAGSPQIIVPGRNTDGCPLVQRYGFRQCYANTHMRRGGSGLASQRDQIFGQASFGFG